MERSNVSKLFSSDSTSASRVSRVQELEAMPRPPWGKPRTTEQWAENRAWAILREVHRGNMTRADAMELCRQVWNQLKSDPMPDPQRERLKNLLNGRGSTF